MKTWFVVTHEFYVGYVAKAPEGTTLIVRKVVLVSSIAMICIGAVLAWHQKKFSATNFEYRVRTELQGYIFRDPIPHLLISMGRNSKGKELYQTVLLVGPGKAGFDEALRNLNVMEKILEGFKVKLNGSLIYGDGKTLLQVDDESNIESTGAEQRPASKIEWTENLMVSGEIVDPKCYFGVMKPGEGKAHRACAIRCIAGGIPPVFSTDSLGYFLIVDENNNPMPKEIENIVGDHVTLEGVGMHWNDWTILRVNSKDILELSVNKKWKEKFLALEEDMKQCK